MGKIIDKREDNTGPYVVGLANLKTTAGRDAFEHVVAEDVDCFSFGFNTMDDKRNSNGIREIHKVNCLECGPVIFEANHRAVIVDKRSMMTLEERKNELKDVDVRDVDFKKNMAEIEKHYRRGMLIESLLASVDDIYYSLSYGDISLEEGRSAAEKSISAFQAEYLKWMTDVFSDDAKRQAQNVMNKRAELAYTVRKKIVDIETYAKDSSFTVAELSELSKGNLLKLDSRSKIKCLGEDVEKIHNELRSELIDSIFDELKENGLSDFEKRRISTLLEKSKKQDPIEDIDVEANIKDLREIINQ
jgi:hypothetical protein